MARIKDPVRFSTRFGVRPAVLKRLGVLDVTLNADTALFIDPLLLDRSGPREMNRASKRFREHFEKLARLLAVSQTAGDVAWRSARRLLRFSEVKGTCLGYGAGTIAGTGMGAKLTDRLLNTAKEIVDLGVTDPDLFLSLALIEEDLGPDRISDMTTNVILPDLAKYGERIAARLDVQVKPFEIDGQRYRLPASPFEDDTPVLLLPINILRPLPVAADWRAVCSAAAHNERFRERVNQHIGAIWVEQSRRQKEELREQALSSRESFETLLGALHKAKPKPYAFDRDPAGLLRWRERLDIARQYPITLRLPSRDKRKLDDVADVVTAIVRQFQALVEDNGLWKDLWSGPKRRPEKAAQRLFFAVADSYCKANKLDLSPETDAGGGPVDFKISNGGDAKVLVEIKLSSNSKLIQGYTTQLETYKAAEKAIRAVYLVIEVGELGKRGEKLESLRKRALKAGGVASDLVFVDGTRKRSASKR